MNVSIACIWTLASTRQQNWLFVVGVIGCCFGQEKVYTAFFRWSRIVVFPRIFAVFKEAHLMSSHVIPNLSVCLALYCSMGQLFLNHNCWHVDIWHHCYRPHHRPSHVCWRDIFTLFVRKRVLSWCELPKESPTPGFYIPTERARSTSGSRSRSIDWGQSSRTPPTNPGL